MTDDQEDAAEPHGNHVVEHKSADLDADLSEILEALPEGSRQEVLEVISARESHSGWLPTPQYLREYDDILPGLAERIVAMPEREQAHRHKVIEGVMRDDRDLKRRGQNYALISLFALLAVAILLIALGQYRWGAMVAIFGIAGVVGIFVTGKVADVKAANQSKSDDDSEVTL